MAIKYGITEFVVEFLKMFPFVVSHDLGKNTMLQMAIMERNVEISNQIVDFIILDDTKDDILCKEDESCSNILHYAAILAPPHQLNSVSGPALQMQREVQWFKGVRRLVHPFLRDTRNADGLTAQYVFTEQHKGLRKTGEKWLKDTSGSCMVVATLIATVAFAAAFTVPGGNAQQDLTGRKNGVQKIIIKNGFPVFLREPAFIVFVAADAVALFSSITSVILFLAIMTSRYAEEDFLKSLPQKLIIGLAMLFISMANILVAFCASFTLILVADKQKHVWIPVTISCFGFIPVLSFFYLQFPLFLEMLRATFWPSILKIKNRQHLLSEKEIRRTFRQRSIWRIAMKEREINQEKTFNISQP
ncbi:ankyrin repeat-containing protein NPR4-like [Papaver somniferum]|uniref:ankyrin repeat-containing protein NPR4-like n=1 Tax=Papaver somniferum TaxID=3469 RepID=UPI000E6F612E|nr:ankyrin repeat-containing protein NPR4-like [Papaver somniferum]